MPLVSLDTLPDDARLWIFGAERRLSPFERTELLSEVDRFLVNWRAHGTPLTAARALTDDRFLMVAVDQASVPPSGCSIDAMVAVLMDLQVRLGVELVDHGALYYRGPAGDVRSVDRPTFRRRVEAGEVDGDTPGLDTTLTRLGSVRSGRWERPACASWHGRAFLRRPAASAQQLGCGPVIPAP